MPAIAQIDDYLFIGSIRSSKEADILIGNGITAIVSLQDAGAVTKNPGNLNVIPSERHLKVHCQDKSTMDLIGLLPKVCKFIDNELFSVNPGGTGYEQQAKGPPGQLPSPDTPGTETSHSPGPRRSRVLIHCSQGLSRAPAVAIGYLMRHRREGLHSILARMKHKRDIRPRDTFLEQLQLWETLGYWPWEDERGEVPKREYEKYLQELSRKVGSMRAPPPSDEDGSPRQDRGSGGGLIRGCDVQDSYRDYFQFKNHDPTAAGTIPRRGQRDDTSASLPPFLN